MILGNDWYWNEETILAWLEQNNQTIDQVMLNSLLADNSTNVTTTTEAPEIIMPFEPSPVTMTEVPWITQKGEPPSKIVFKKSLNFLFENDPIQLQRLLWI